MADASKRPPRVSREMRVLILSIFVSGAVLLLLARIRFPERPAVVDTSSQPLERLAARASFEELATRVASVEASIAPRLLVLRLARHLDARPVRLADLTAPLGGDDADARHVPALRIGTAAAVASIPHGTRIAGIVGTVGPQDSAGVIATDPVRRLARIRVPEGPLRPLAQLALSALETPTYVLAVEGTRAGLTMRPIFLGRSDRFASPRWRRPLLPLGGAIVIPGALLFTLDGEFLGCAVMEEGTLAIAGAGDVLDTAEALRGGPGPLADPGIAVQPLSTAVATVTGAPAGVVVAEVVEGTPAAGVLLPADVITRLNGRAVSEAEALLVDLGRALPAGKAEVSFVRDRETHTAELLWQPSPITAKADEPGIRLEFVRDVGSRVRGVAPGSPFEDAGLAPGDVIVRAGDTVAPAPGQVEAIVSDATRSSGVLIVFRRGARQHVTAVRVEDSGDATRR